MQRSKLGCTFFSTASADGLAAFVHAASGQAAAGTRTGLSLSQLVSRCAEVTLPISDTRSLRVKSPFAGAALVSFDALCNTPTSTSEFKQLCSSFETIFLYGIPEFDTHQHNAVSVCSHCGAECCQQTV